MPIPMRGRVRGSRRSTFDVRRTALGFVLLAVLVCGVGLTLRTALASAERHPVPAAAVLVVLVTGAVALLRRRRNRRAAARGAVAAVETAYEVVDAALAEPAPAEPAPAYEPAPPAYEPAPPAAGPAASEPVDWEAMDPYDFEEAVAALCRRDGCPDAEVVGGAGDLGADVVATTPDGRRLVVQCKRYTAENKVGSQDLQRFGGTCYAVHGASTAVVVTTSTFTEPALEYAAQCGIVCVDLAGLTAWGEDGAPLPWHTRPAALPVEG
ncbi:restriction endonuclease [Streptomyces sp. SID3915]|uniref:restriction endonuclease n=1 Tax=Streptomyces sp. SID3915 TaxID=2690263 RepID=UPI00136891CC|nr:restriction endonuclease [Streptomyces sp. SID3915]MYX73304.1 restriction endonuclease [Streptomyces sp. SID3915]